MSSHDRIKCFKSFRLQSSSKLWIRQPIDYIGLYALTYTERAISNWRLINVRDATNGRGFLTDGRDVL